MKKISKVLNLIFLIFFCMILHEFGHLLVIIFSDKLIFNGFGINSIFVTIAALPQNGITIFELYLLGIAGVGICFIAAIILSISIHRTKVTDTTWLKIIYIINFLVPSLIYIFAGIGDFAHIIEYDVAFSLNVYFYIKIIAGIITLICLISIGKIIKKDFAEHKQFLHNFKI